MGPRQFYEFGPFCLDVSERLLYQNGRLVPLPPKLVSTLLFLVEKRGHIVEKDELMKAIWPETFVEESSLSRNVYNLRKTLSDGHDGREYIQTIPKRGYRFVAAVQQGSAGAHEAAKVTPATPKDSTSLLSESPAAPATKPRPRKAFALGLLALGIGAVVLAFLAVTSRLRNVHDSAPRRIESLAVLPLENLSRDPAEDYLADGMADELITDLAKIQALRVISRASVVPYKGTKKPLRQIARELNVDAVVEGTVLRSGDRVRVSAQLVEAAEDWHLWAESHERDLRDVPALQEEVARAIADNIQVKLAPQERQRLASARPVNAEAYEAYLQGRFILSWAPGKRYDSALKYFTEAISKDRGYAPAYSGLADTYYRLGAIAALAPEQAYLKSKAAAAKPLALDDTASEAHASLAMLAFLHDWDWPLAEREFKRAIDLNASDSNAHGWYGIYLIALGRKDEAFAEGRKARELDPLYLDAGGVIQYLCFLAHQYDQAIEEAKKIAELGPDRADIHYSLACSYEQKERYREAIGEYLRAEELWGTAKEQVSALRRSYEASGMEGFWREEIRLEKAKGRSIKPYDLALMYAMVGDKSAAFEWLEKAYHERAHGVPLLNVDPRLRGLHSDPRFQDLVQRVGLPP